MTIETNYDLIDTINQAKGKYSLKKCVKTGLIVGTPSISFLTIALITEGIKSNIPPEEIIKIIIICNTALFPTLLLSEPLKNKLVEYMTGLNTKQQAELRLTDLSIKLNKSYVKTSLPLLLESKEYHKEHKLILNKKGLPCIMQNKYIMVPTYDNGDIKEKSILQEHQIGSRKYILSLGRPTKAKQFKPAYNNGF